MSRKKIGWCKRFDKDHVCCHCIVADDEARALGLMVLFPKTYFPTGSSYFFLLLQDKSNIKHLVNCNALLYFFGKSFDVFIMADSYLQPNKMTASAKSFGKLRKC